MTLNLASKFLYFFVLSSPFPGRNTKSNHDINMKQNTRRCAGAKAGMVRTEKKERKSSSPGEVEEKTERRKKDQKGRNNRG